MLTSGSRIEQGEQSMAAKDHDDTAGNSRRGAVRDLSAYFALVFAITWGLGAAFLFARPQLEAVVGPMGQINQHWLYFVAVFAPTISAVVCSLALGGWAGVKSLLLGLVRPTPLIWVAIAILSWPLTLAAFALATHAAEPGGQVDLHALAIGAPLLAFTTLALVTDPGGFGEELGWRGFALPRLLRITSPLAAAVVLGTLWGVWHLPAFFISGLAQTRFGFGWFVFGAVVETVWMTWLYLHANGNVIVAGVIPHLMWNLVYDANVLSGDVIRIEVTALSVLVVGVLVVFGPGLKGWRRKDQAA
jgi:membrane protease YdiL (CAAX protease family)